MQLNMSNRLIPQYKSMYCMLLFLTFIGTSHSEVCYIFTYYSKHSDLSCSYVFVPVMDKYIMPYYFHSALYRLILGSLHDQRTQA